MADHGAGHGGVGLRGHIDGPGDEELGRVGVIGPMRMDYRRTIKIVEEVSEGLGDSIGS